ncbi:MAG TPA: hypothetical protein VD994_15905 [Prosthecobacter sp.]|nr:hypothetical protein [Prosthecobacter sp.]
MTPFHAAQQVYQRELCARDFWTDLHLHLTHGYVFSTPTAFLMGRPVERMAPHHQITNPAHHFQSPDAWLVYLAAGDGIREFFRYEPFPLPYFGWERNNKLRFYERNKLLTKLTIPSIPIDFHRYGGASG